MTTELIPAATLLLLRDKPHGLEVLLLKRHKNAGFLPDHWVFPGGIIEAQDQHTDLCKTARIAAVRETHEECGIHIDARQLVTLSRWIAPDISPKRFDTRFFIASHNNNQSISLDQKEISDYCWLTPTQALARHRRGQLPILPPTLVSLHDLQGFENSVQALEYYQSRQAICFAPRACFWQDQLVILYEGDAGFTSGDAEKTDVLHRCVQTLQGWEYYKTGTIP